MENLYSCYYDPGREIYIVNSVLLYLLSLAGPVHPYEHRWVMQSMAISLISNVEGHGLNSSGSGQHPVNMENNSNVP
jgi:hypothetical protein